MIKHFIVMASSYSLKKRIALDYYSKEELNMEEIQKDIDFIVEKCGNDVPISTHFIQTKSIGWDEVVELDKFFDKVQLIENKEEFVEIILNDRVLNGLDVAKYILTKVPCTHLKLQKLTYMCYADYLCNENSKLFEDKIYAFDLGPVLETVYNNYKRTNSSLLEIEDDNELYDEIDKELPVKSRLVFSEDGLKKIFSIDKTLEKYSDYSASELVKMTHNESSPWSKVFSKKESFQEISDDLIKEYHKNEEM